LHAIEFLTGFIVGTNLTGNGKEMDVCGSTITLQLSEGAKAKSLMQKSSIDSKFDAVYTIYNMMFYSKQLAFSCNSLYEVGLTTGRSTLLGILDVNRIINNLSHSFITAYDSFIRLKTFL
jgi:hypothetical protein